jgi:hypothetical protein
MRSSKDRTIEKKRRNKAMKVSKTEASRKKRIANKHKREEIHAIDPDMKVIVMNQKTFDEYGTEIEVMDGHIRAVKLDPEIVEAAIDFCNKPADFDSAVIEYQEVIDKEHPVVEEIKLKNKSALQRLTDRFKKG